MCIFILLELYDHYKLKPPDFLLKSVFPDHGLNPQSFVPLSTLVASEDSLDRLLDLNLTDKDKLVQQASLIADDLQNMSADNLLNKSVDTLLEHFQKIPEAKKAKLGG